jgi:phosphopantothenoylcysteine decarboxylase / phosphopantothenate---cysteine ligase
MLKNKRILLIIGGGIAAYKSLELIRRLKERGARVTVSLTKAATEFVTPLSAASLSGNKVYTDLFSLTDEAEMGHIQLSRSRSCRRRARNRGPAGEDGQRHRQRSRIDAPAGDRQARPCGSGHERADVASPRHVAQCCAPAEDGVLFVGPDEGDMACGEFGPAEWPSRWQSLLP